MCLSYDPCFVYVVGLGQWVSCKVYNRNMGKNKVLILEGFHVCKHALRFGADIIELVTADTDALENMLTQYASDIKEEVLERVEVISQKDFDNYSNITIRTPLAGKAFIPPPVRPGFTSARPVVLLDEPRDLENIGAVVRLCAGMEAGAVLTTGHTDPWHKNCLRGSQGLHYALPVSSLKQIEIGFLSERVIIVFDESGEDLMEVEIPDNVVLVFGSERQGISPEWLEQADKVVKIPQQEDVSSYNLATSVAMALYHEKIGRHHKL